MPDELRQALFTIEEIKGVLSDATAEAWTDHVNAAWDIWEKTGRHHALVALVAKLRAFAVRVNRGHRMLPVLLSDKHPRAAEVAAGLLPGALATHDARVKWEAAARLCWNEFIANSGPFAREIIQETACFSPHPDVESEAGGA